MGLGGIVVDRVDVAAVVRRGRVLCGGSVVGIRLGQTVCAHGALVVAVDAVVVVKRALVGACGIRVQKRAADLLFLVAGLVGVLCELAHWHGGRSRWNRGRTGA